MASFCNGRWPSLRNWQRLEFEACHLKSNHGQAKPTLMLMQQLPHGQMMKEGAGNRIDPSDRLIVHSFFFSLANLSTLLMLDMRRKDHDNDVAKAQLHVTRYTLHAAFCTLHVATGVHTLKTQAAALCGICHTTAPRSLAPFPTSPSLAAGNCRQFSNFRCKLCCKPLVVAVAVAFLTSCRLYAYIIYTIHICLHTYMHICTHIYRSIHNSPSANLLASLPHPTTTLPLIIYLLKCRFEG